MLSLKTFWNKKTQGKPRSVEHLVVPERVRSVNFFYNICRQKFLQIKTFTLSHPNSLSEQHTFNVVYVSSFVMICSFL